MVRYDDGGCVRQFDCRDLEMELMDFPDAWLFNTACINGKRW